MRMVRHWVQASEHAMFKSSGGVGTQPVLQARQARVARDVQTRSRKTFQGITVPKGPKGEKRPTDVIGAAVHVMRIATGRIEDSKREKDPTRLTP